MLEEEVLEVYVDASVQGQSVGVAVKIKEILSNGNEVFNEVASKQFFNAKSGQAEILACVYALEEIDRQRLAEGKRRLLLYSDSKYVVEGNNRDLIHWVGHGMFMKGGKPVLDFQEWKKLAKQRENYFRKYRIRVEIKKAQAHAGDDYNNSVDAMAREVAQQPAFRFPKPTSVLSPSRPEKLTIAKWQNGTVVRMNGQQISIKILDREYWQKNIWVYKYEVFMHRTSSWAFSEQKIFSNLSMDIGKYYLARVNANDHNPWIVDAQEITDESVAV